MQIKTLFDVFLNKNVSKNTEPETILRHFCIILLICYFVYTSLQVCQAYCQGLQ